MRIGLRIDFEAQPERGETRADEVKMLLLVSGMAKGFTDELAKRPRRGARGRVRHEIARIA
jgi:hypothetical protein